MGHAVNDEIKFEHYTGVTGETIAYVVLDEARASFEAGNLSEDGTIAGLYYQAFTPDAGGWWRVLITDGTLRRQLAYLVGSGQEKDIEDKVDILDTNIDTILADLVDGGRLDLLIDAILVDTGTTLPATLTAIAAYLDTEIAAILEDTGTTLPATLSVIAGYLTTEIAEILSDTGELQTDWADGGRLDLILDTLALEATLTAMKGDGWTAETLKAIYDLLDALMDVSETGDTLTADGSEQVVYEQASPSGIWNPCVVYIDLTNMATDDAITVKEYVKIKSGGDYLLLDTKDYIHAQTRKVINVSPVGRKNRYGYKVTLDQTAGTNRTYDWEAIYES